MSHILIIGCGPAGISAALRLAERGQKVTLASAKPPIYHRCAGLPGIDLPEDAAQELRAMGAQSLSGHEVMHALNRRLLRYESGGDFRFCPYHRLLRLAVGDGRCVGGVLFHERTGRLEGVVADAVLLATGGMHTMFHENRFGCDGLAAALAFQAGAALRNPDQINTSGRYPIFESGLITSWDGETTVPGLYAAGECADGTAAAFPFSQAMATGTAAADYLSESLPEADPIEAGCAVAEAVNGVQTLIDAFRKTSGSRAPAAVERRIRETVQRTMTGGRTARLLQRGLLDIRVMRQQAGRGEYDLGEGLYPVLRLPSLLYLLEIMLTTAAFRLLRQDGDLTVALRDGKIDVTAKRSAAVEAAAYTPEATPPAVAPATGEPQPEAEKTPSARDELIGVGSALQNAAANEFAAKYHVPRASSKQKKEPEPAPEAAPEAAEETALPPGTRQSAAPALEDVGLSEDTISFQPIKALEALAAKAEQIAARPVPPIPEEYEQIILEQIVEGPQPSASVPVPEPEPLPEPVPESAPDAEPEPVPEQIAEPIPEPVPEPAPVPAPAFVPEQALASVPAVTGQEAVLDPTPGGAAELPERREPEVFSTETVLEYGHATAEPVEPPLRDHEVFLPDPEALLALATARRAQEESAQAAKKEESARSEAGTNRFGGFEADPEALLSISRDE